MTTPVRESFTAFTEATNVETHTLNMPATTVSGELLQARFSVNVISTLTPPSGWTVNKKITQDATFDVELYVMSIIADGTEGGTNPTFETSVPSSSTGGVTQYSGQGSFEISTGVTGSGQPPNSDNLNVTWGEDTNLYISLCGITRGDQTITAAPSGYGNFQTSTTGGFSADCAFGEGDLAKSGSGSDSENPGAFSISTNRLFAACTIGIEPAAVVVVSLVEPEEQRSYRHNHRYL